SARGLRHPLQPRADAAAAARDEEAAEDAAGAADADAAAQAEGGPAASEAGRLIPSMLRFLEPGMARWLLLLPVVFACWWLHVRAKRRFREQARISPVLQALSRLRSARRDRAALVASLVALAALVLALTRPQLYVQLRVPEYERRDLVR